ncbi:hypothetical protein SteCoe_34808 [Stentor coeruleus]|uniref:RING-type domain-containing protein n=1 Tax=Stentor coeruleus TaxID=5963 RepID=A0A1R2ATQ7_9CILI|nr:hypothetical protein SteCoe_34808 [Stentor coeruleus]
MSDSNQLAIELPSDNVIANRQDEDRQLAERNRQDVIAQIRIWYEYFLLASGFLLLLRISYSSSLPKLVPFALLTTYETTWIARLLKKLRLSQQGNSSRYLCKDLFVVVCNFLFFLLLTLHAANIGIFFVLTCIPLYFCNFVTLMKKSEYNSKCKDFASRSESAFRWILSITILFSGLKSLNLIDWKWHFVFWPIWVLVVSLGLIGIAQIIHAGKVAYKAIKGMATCIDAICPIWMVYFCIGCGICIGNLFFEFLLYYEDGRSKRISDALVIMLLYFIGLFVLTFLFNNILITWFERYFYSGRVIMYNNQMFIPPLTNISTSQIIIEIKDHPQKMLKMSSIFYVSLDENYDDQHEENKSEVDFNSVNIDGSIENGKTCSICCEKEADAIIMNCGHGGICFDCSCEIVKKTKKCHICRTVIEKIYQFKPYNSSEVEVVRAIRYCIGQ